MTAAEIQQMPWKEKLRSLVELWEAVACEGNRCGSPAWHQEALNGVQYS